MTDMGDGHDDDWMHAKTLVKPDDQLQLSESVSPTGLVDIILVS